MNTITINKLNNKEDKNMMNYIKNMMTVRSRKTELFCMIAGEKAVNGISVEAMELIHYVETGYMTSADLDRKYDEIIRDINEYTEEGLDAPEELYEEKEMYSFVLNYVGV